MVVVQFDRDGSGEEYAPVLIIQELVLKNDGRQGLTRDLIFRLPLKEYVNMNVCACKIIIRCAAIVIQAAIKVKDKKTTTETNHTYHLRGAGW